jgi:hypothetical protein
MKKNAVLLVSVIKLLDIAAFYGEEITLACKF